MEQLARGRTGWWHTGRRVGQARGGACRRGGRSLAACVLVYLERLVVLFHLGAEGRLVGPGCVSSKVTVEVTDTRVDLLSPR